jgi:hypothetical protein
VAVPEPEPYPIPKAVADDGWTVLGMPFAEPGLFATIKRELLDTNSWPSRAAARTHSLTTTPMVSVEAEQAHYARRTASNWPAQWPSGRMLQQRRRIDQALGAVILEAP